MGMMRGNARRAVLAPLTTCLAIGYFTGEARAGEFAINSCAADRGGYSTQAFDAFATRGMLVKRACNPTGRGVRGLVTANVVRRTAVRRGSRAVVQLQAAPGTTFKTLRWSGAAQRRDCAWEMELWASGPGVLKTIKTLRAGQECPQVGSAQAAGWPRPRRYDIRGATRIVQRVICKGADRRSTCSSSDLNYFRTLSASVTVVDAQAPQVRITGGGLASGAWVRGEQSITFDASDNVGIASERVFAAGLERARNARPCSPARPVPCPSGPGQLRFDSSGVPDGQQPVGVDVTDGAGNRGGSTATALIDNTPPRRVDLALEGGDGWRRVNGFSVSWNNPPEVHAPISAAHFRVCRADTTDCTPGERRAAGIDRVGEITVPAPGEWALTVWREDAAGNADERLASVPVKLRFDPEPPELGFEQSPATDPTRMSVLVTDNVSGLASGEIELSRQGSGTWQALRTERDGNRLVAHVDDAALPDGVYLLRARASDHAGNESSTDRRLDGSPMVVTLPLRATATMRAGVAKSGRVRKVIRRGGRRRVVRRRVTRLVPRARVSLGRTVRVSGRLGVAGGSPLTAEPVQIYARTHDSERLVGTVRTDGRGRYRYRIRASENQVLRLAYAGTSTVRPVERELVLLVPAKTALRVSRRHVVNGQTVVFLGRLRALPPPAGGKLVELQVQLSGRWQTFRTTRTKGDGTWQTSYRFQRTRGRQRYRFRARLPAEAGYPFESGRSRPVTVLVRGA